MLNSEESIQLITEAYDHLWQGRYRLAMNAASKAYENRPEDYNAAVCYAWALLENGNPARALELANYAVEVGGDSLETRLFRGFFLSRMSIFEGASSDLDASINKLQSLLVFSLYNKARTLAGMNRFQEAAEILGKALVLEEDPAHSEINDLLKYYQTAPYLLNDQNNSDNGQYKYASEVILSLADEACRVKEYWFSLLAARIIIKRCESEKSAAKESGESSACQPDQIYQEALLIELESMYSMFQYRPVYEKALRYEKILTGNPKFGNLYPLIVKAYGVKGQEENGTGISAHDIPLLPSLVEDASDDNAGQPESMPRILNINKRIEFRSYPNRFARFLDIKMFDMSNDNPGGRRRYINQFEEEKLRVAGAEIIFENPAYSMRNLTLSGKSLWFLDDELITTEGFKIKIDKSWPRVSFIQSYGDETYGFWHKGQGRFEIHIDKELICEKYFLIGETEISQAADDTPVYDEFLPYEKTETPEEISYGAGDDRNPAGRPSVRMPASSDLPELLEELDKLTGLHSLKKTVRDFVGYLNFLNERKKMGLKAESSLAVHCVFRGNPGTGKTTVARLLGNIFRAMGILESGHVVEADRGALVGQYIGETALKTEKKITEATGGVLFIDEAYTLFKKGAGAQDFGQEAIDTLLKKMEDGSGSFVVIAAGYPDEMNSFIESNPGLKSRFSHFFDFEDFNPDELTEIFISTAAADEYKVEDAAVEMLRDHFTSIYRQRDKSFGNARIVKNMFNASKMSLGKRYLGLAQEEKTKENLTTIRVSDIEQLMKKEKTENVKIPVDEKTLSVLTGRLNELVGIETVKKEVDEIIRLVRYYAEKGEDLGDKFSSHFLFLGNPGTGKTTVARLLAKIYSALGILSKGHLVEADRQMLVSSYIGQTARQTTELIEKAIGGTLFIDEAYSLVKKDSPGDFGQEAVDTLLKKMEDLRGEFIVVAAGYTEEMNRFLESNPGLRSRFNRIITFDDYSPDELFDITLSLLKEKNLLLSDDAAVLIKNHYMEIYRQRDKNFGNARIVRNLVETASKNQMLRTMNARDDTAEDKELLTTEDVLPVISDKKKKHVRIEINQQLLDKYMAELNSMTGLDSVKKGVEKLVNGLKVAKMREQRGLSVIEKNLHSVFLGNPGTGKTTIARLLSRIYKEMGLLEKGHLVEVDRAALVAGYQGQTAIKTDNIIKQALGGTLFIDEAYTLWRGGNDFGQEAIDTLLKRMEDYRGSFAVIAAGYPAEMQQFLSSNPGLQSRITNYFEFEDYTPRQLLEIADQINQANGYKFDEGALQFMLEIFTKLYNNRDRNFGNARTAKKILYEAISNQEERITGLFNCSDEELMTITIEDVGKLLPGNYKNT